VLICGLDFETTGLIDGDKIPSVVELGMVVWDTDLHLPIKMMGFLVDPGPDVSWNSGDEQFGAKFAGDINGLSPEICTKYGYGSEKALRQLLGWYQPAEYACAHNGLTFDRLILKAWAEKYGYDWQPNKVWIDTSIDIELPPKMSTRLTYMACDHGFLNPFPHRALLDVLTMMQILDRYDLGPILEMAKSPTLQIKAVVEYDDRELAKARGYRPKYENDRFKMWTKSIKECKLAQEREEAPFPVEIVIG
jgi:DNA polymerase-3 subunit epsilon